MFVTAMIFYGDMKNVRFTLTPISSGLDSFSRKFRFHATD